MLQLKDLTLDFVNKEITVPSDAPQRSDVAPNMCFGNGMTLNCAGSVLNTPVMMNIDTGDAACGSLGVSFFDANKDFIMAHAEADTVRRGGLGGVVESLCYRADSMPVSLGGHTVGVPGLVVETGQSTAAMSFECNIGLKTLMMFGQIRFNMADFVLTTYPVSLLGCESRHYNAPSLRITSEKGPSVLQTMGLVTLCIANGLINQNAPSAPDL